jgi:hypothetical protein
MNAIKAFIVSVPANATVNGTVAQGLSLALSRATGVKRQALLKIGEDPVASLSLIESLRDKVSKGALSSMGDVASWLMGQHLIN